MSPNDDNPTISPADDANRVLVEEADGMRQVDSIEEFPERSECIFAEIYGDMAGL